MNLSQQWTFQKPKHNHFNWVIQNYMYLSISACKSVQYKIVTFYSSANNMLPFVIFLTSSSDVDANIYFIPLIKFIWICVATQIRWFANERANLIAYILLCFESYTLYDEVFWMRSFFPDWPFLWNKTSSIKHRIF